MPGPRLKTVLHGTTKRDDEYKTVQAKVTISPGANRRLVSVHTGFGAVENIPADELIEAIRSAQGES